MTPLLLATAMLLAQGLSGGGEDLSTKETRAVIHSYAQCVVKRQPARASAAILSNHDNKTIIRKHPQLMIGDCLRPGPQQVVKAQFPGDLYRYALADALVSRDLAGSNPLDFAAVPKLDHRDPGPAPEQVGPQGKKLSAKKFQEALDTYRTSAAFAYLSRYGECVVRVAPAASKALLLTMPDSGDESASFKALTPALATCLPEGETLRFGKVTLRGTIAINYYRLAIAARAASIGTAG